MLNLPYLILGIICGTITGLFPGIHPNNIVALSFLIIPFFGVDNYIPFLIGLVITHYFINFIPSAFLGVPDDETATSALPMHRLTLNGKGFEAIVLAGFGSYLGVIFSIIITLFLIFILNVDINSFYHSVKPLIPFILITFVIYQILTSKSIWEILVIFLSGIFGIVVLYCNNAYNITLTAIFTGMFGIPLLINNLKTYKIKSQIITFPDFNIKFLKSSFFASIVGFFRIFLPGVSGAQLNYILSKILSEKDLKNFIISQGSIILSNEVFSLLSIIFIGIGRSGVARAIQILNANIDINIAIFSILISSTIALIILINLSKYILIFIRKVNFKYLSLFFIIFCSLVIVIGSYNTYLSYHIIVYLTSICIGLLALKSQSNLSNMMNVLIFPTILYFLMG
ncbi:tripartite tricarboxylate transporter permease [Methanocaldococcus sp.]|uniref:tripartite tricarboxylate transporter permease n=1 Tax=Methanocaldococcus sp. TaxID=2152917 RepID=UPI0026398E61|nr:tripartite tricarboxylate transporter permease [Methanocaldococcus sp.]MCQ6253890.1 tripartite tricarboxylate transporter permease [Methanocaldococcus sp.]